MNNLQWFTGIVVDVDDPLKVGRVRILIHGIHSDIAAPSIKKGIGVDIECLPWAIPVQSVVSAANNGVGVSPTGYDIDTQVFGVSTSKMYDNLFILGAIAGAPGGQSDIPEVAQGIKDDITQKKANTQSGVSIAGGGSWSEPNTSFAAEYPNNHAYKSKSGHLIEIDDTKGSERVTINHKSGTFVEMHPNGDFHIRSTNDNYEITHANKYIYVKGDINISANNCNIKAESNCVIDANNVEITANSIKASTGTLKVDCSGSANITAGAGFDIYSPIPSSITGLGGLTLIGNKTLTI